MKSRLLGIRILTILLALTIAFPVPVFCADEDAVAETEEPETISYEQTDVPGRRLTSRVIKPRKRLKADLAKLMKSNKGYDIVQGGCTNGKYAYYLMVSSKTQKGRVLKVKLKNHKVVKRSKVLRTWHGNGMAYDSKRKKLVVIAREHRKQEITVIDAKTLKITRQQNVKYDYFAGAGKDSLWSVHQRQGLAAIAYVKKYDVYVALERVYHNLLIFDPDTFEAIGMVFTEIPDAYPGTFQAMDADEKYVYLLMSSYQKNPAAQPYNLIVALDWNSECLMPVTRGEVPFIEKGWYCHNSGNGAPDAVIRLRTKHEAENIYHTTDKSGRAHFYLAEYYNKPVYKKSGKKKKLRYYKRKDYVYDLGII